MDMMATFFPESGKPLRISSVDYLESSDGTKNPNKVCVTALCGNSHITLHSIPPADIRAFAEQLIAGLNRLTAPPVADFSQTDLAVA